MKEFKLSEEDLTIDTAGIAGIHDVDDLLDYLEMNFTGHGFNEIEESLQKYIYRSNLPYLRFLGSVLIMVAEFGYPSLNAMFNPGGVRYKVEILSGKDFLDPRNLLNLAIYFAKLTKTLAEDFRIPYADQKHELKSDDFMIKLLTGFPIVENGAMYLNSKFFTIPFQMINYDRSRHEKNDYIYYDERFVNSLAINDDYNFKVISNISWNEFQNQYLELAKNAFPGIDIQRIFEDEFTYGN